MPIFKIWTSDRSIKKFVSIPIISVNDLKESASKKFDFFVKSIVLESDGTIVDDDEALELVSKEILVILKDTETWCPRNEYLFTKSFESGTSTLTCPSTPEFASYPVFSSPSPNTSTDASNITDEESANVPWNILPPHITQLLEEKKRPSYSDLNQIIQLFVDNIRTTTKYPGRVFIREYCRKIVSKYPNSFLDKDEEGNVIGNGYCTIFKKIEDRNNYKNRTCNNKELTSTLKFGYKKRKRSNLPEWQPEKLPDDEDEESVNIKKNRLIDLHASKCACDNDDVLSAMDLTFIPLRLILNQKKPSPLKQIMREWPYLFNEMHLLLHFERMSGCKLLEILNSSEEKMKKVTYFLTHKKEETDDINKILINALINVSKHFKDDMNSILIEEEETVTKDDLLKNRNLVTPTIMSISGKSYYIFMENEIIAESNHFINSFAVFFAAYYVFNLKYPSTASLTMEFVQRYFVRLNMDGDSKANTKSSKTNTVLNKVLSLMQKLRNFSM